ncbi:MAG: enoyl-CoA hydratase/isomerase family protein, partial [Acetobacteraceae bacterium]
QRPCHAARFAETAVPVHCPPHEPQDWERSMGVVTVEQRGLISLIRINRPDRLNAISSAVAIELQSAFQAFDASAQRVAVISAAGERAFTAGADVSDLPELWRCIPTVGFATDKPIIAATSGWCVGGGVVLVMMCDLLVASETTTFYYPEAKLGTTGGMISSLVTRMPHHLAMEMLLLGTKISAQRAYDVGFVNRLTPPGEHETAAIAMAGALAAQAPLVMGTLKRLVGEIMPTGPIERMVAASRAIARVRGSEDMQEGLRAYKEKREPRFRGQ